jgi:hypothetical protein
MRQGCFMPSWAVPKGECARGAAVLSAICRYARAAAACRVYPLARGSRRLLASLGWLRRRWWSRGGGRRWCGVPLMAM